LAGAEALMPDVAEGEPRAELVDIGVGRQLRPTGVCLPEAVKGRRP